MIRAHPMRRQDPDLRMSLSLETLFAPNPHQTWRTSMREPASQAYRIFDPPYASLNKISDDNIAYLQILVEGGTP